MKLLVAHSESLISIMAIKAKIEDRTSLDSKSHLPCEVISERIEERSLLNLDIEGGAQSLSSRSVERLVPTVIVSHLLKEC